MRSDESKKSFLFTLKNAHNTEAMIFRLKDNEENSAITVSSKFGPCFGAGDLTISKHNDGKANSTVSFGTTYFNSSGIEGGLFFTGSETFRVKEIEVFEWDDGN
jgi:hypothetical protein